MISLIWFKILFYKYFSLQNYIKLYYNNQHSLLVCLKTIKINTITFETQKYYKHGMSNLYIYSNLKIYKSDLNSYNILSLCPSTELNKLYRCISTNYNMVTCQSANQLKKVSWAFTMVSQFGSLGYTIMGKTADLTDVQKTIIDTLHKEEKTQTFITKEAVHRVMYPSMLTESWVEGKRCTTNRENRSLMRIVKKNPFKNLGELHKEWTEAGVKASRAPHTDVSMNFGALHGSFCWAAF